MWKFVGMFVTESSWNGWTDIYEKLHEYNLKPEEACKKIFGYKSGAYI